jgi:hypothetical protein
MAENVAVDVDDLAAILGERNEKDGGRTPRIGCFQRIKRLGPEELAALEVVFRLIVNLELILVEGPFEFVRKIAVDSFCPTMSLEKTMTSSERRVERLNFSA